MSAGPSRALIGAAAAFTVALFLFGGALLRAFSTDALLLPPPAAPAADGDAEAGAGDRGLTTEALRLAVENDPFTPARQAPAERYRLPGDVDPEPPPEPPAPPPPPPFVLSGTVVTETTGLALITVGDVPPRMMSVGESLLGYRLSSVTPQTATMSNDENDILLRVPAPSRAVAATPERSQQRVQQQRGREEPQSAAAALQQRVMMQQILERARQAGANPQMLEQLMRMVNERGINAIENLEIGPTGFTVRGGGGVMRMETRTVPTPARPRPDTMELRMPRAPDLR